MSFMIFFLSLGCEVVIVVVVKRDNSVDHCASVLDKNFALKAA
jgi:hypothetical protein